MADPASTTLGELRVLWSWNTEWPADTVEFCPIAPYRHLLLCGTYKLREGQPEDVPPEECQRDGRLHLLDCGRRRELQRVDTAALLDVKWCPAPLADGRLLAAAVDARGRLLLFQLSEDQQPDQQDQQGPRLSPLASRQVAEPGRLALALEWSLPPEGSATAGSGARLAVSDSSGAVTVLQLESGRGGEELTQLWTATCHGHEAWTCGFNHRDGSLVYTGGDDLLFRCYDVRLDPECPVFTNRRHEAGVTSVQSDPLAEHTLRTGSYDEHLYTWDTRSMRRPVERAPLDGGVWRIKRHPRHAGHVLTACMYGGSHVTDAAGGVVASFRRHKSIVYGADWCRLGGDSHGADRREWVDRTPTDTGSADGDGDGDGDGYGYGDGNGNGDVSGDATGDGDGVEHTDSRQGNTVAGDLSVAATCSFYDNLLCLWEI